MILRKETENQLLLFFKIVIAFSIRMNDTPQGDGK